MISEKTRNNKVGLREMRQDNTKIGQAKVKPGMGYLKSIGWDGMGWDRVD